MRCVNSKDEWRCIRPHSSPISDRGTVTSLRNRKVSIRQPVLRIGKIFPSHLVPKLQFAPIWLLGFESVVEVGIREKHGQHLLVGAVPHSKSPTPSCARVSGAPKEYGFGSPAQVRQRPCSGSGFSAVVLTDTEMKMPVT